MIGRGKMGMPEHRFCMTPRAEPSLHVLRPEGMTLVLTMGKQILVKTSVKTLNGRYPLV
jgi:hypothetical protein